MLENSDGIFGVAVFAFKSLYNNSDERAFSIYERTTRGARRSVVRNEAKLFACSRIEMGVNFSAMHCEQRSI